MWPVEWIKLWPFELETGFRFPDDVLTYSPLTPFPLKGFVILKAKHPICPLKMPKRVRDQAQASQRLTYLSLSLFLGTLSGASNALEKISKMSKKSKRNKKENKDASNEITDVSEEKTESVQKNKSVKVIKNGSYIKEE